MPSETVGVAEASEALESCIEMFVKHFESSKCKWSTRVFLTLTYEWLKPLWNCWDSNVSSNRLGPHLKSTPQGTHKPLKTKLKIKFACHDQNMSTQDLVSFVQRQLDACGRRGVVGCVNPMQDFTHSCVKYHLIRWLPGTWEHLS